MMAESNQQRLADRELARRVLEGDLSAFHAMVDQFGAALFGTALSLVGREADAEDLVQETFAAAFRGLGGFEGRSSLKTWLIGILLRRTATYFRRAARRTARFVPLEIARDGIAGVPSPAEATDARVDVAAAIQSLGPEHREVIVLRELESLSYAEIAQVLNIPQGTVESRLFRARRELEERLKAYLP